VRDAHGAGRAASGRGIRAGLSVDLVAATADPCGALKNVRYAGVLKRVIALLELDQGALPAEVAARLRGDAAASS